MTGLCSLRHISVLETFDMDVLTQGDVKGFFGAVSSNMSKPKTCQFVCDDSVCGVRVLLEPVAYA